MDSRATCASVQPIIVSYELYRPPGFEWINIWSKMDIIGSELNQTTILAPTQRPAVRAKYRLRRSAGPSTRTCNIGMMPYFVGSSTAWSPELCLTD
jgi:hypothetical protein